MLYWLFILFIKLQAIPDQVIDKAWEINPYNATAYGALVIVLAAYGILQHRERIKDKEKFLAFTDKALTVLALVQNELPVISEVKALLPVIKDALDKK